MHKITAVIVARKGSKRIVNKNYQKIGEDSLIERKIKQLKKSKLVDNIILGTDDESLRAVAEKHGVEFVRRPDEYCDEVSRTPNDMITNMLSYFKSDYVIWCHVTNPLIDEKTYDDAIAKFLDAKQKAKEAGEVVDSLFSATELRGHFWTAADNGLKTINFVHHSPVHKTAAELPPVYSQNGGIFIRDHETMSQDGHFIGKKPFIYVLDKITGIDIDHPEDLEMARLFALERDAQM